MGDSDAHRPEQRTRAFGVGQAGGEAERGRWGEARSAKTASYVIPGGEGLAGRIEGDFSMNSRAEGPQEPTNQLMGYHCERTDKRSLTVLACLSPSLLEGFCLPRLGLRARRVSRRADEGHRAWHD